MCYPDGEFIVGDRDVLLGVIDLRLGVGETNYAAPDGVDAVPVWISGSQFVAWQHTQLILDVVPGRGSGFSLEAPEGVRFLSRSRAFTAAEHAALAAELPLTGVDWERGDRPVSQPLPTIVAAPLEACPVPGFRSTFRGTANLDAARCRERGARNEHHRHDHLWSGHRRTGPAGASR